MNQILIVDDHPQNCQDLAVMLESLDVAILYCHKGEDAITHIREHNPSLVLLDSEMPNLNGYQVINQMWSDDDLRQIPVLLMTTHFADRKQLLHQPLLEVVDSLPKPINPALLIDRVKMALILRTHQQTIISMLEDGGQAMRKRHEGVLAVDSFGRIAFANATALALLRTNHQMIFGVYIESIFEEPNHAANSAWLDHPIQRVCSQGNVLQVEACVLYCADGNSINVKMAAIPMEAGSDLSMTIAFRQISPPKLEPQEDETAALHLNHYDPLTGVFHRQAFEQVVDDRIKRHESTDTKIAIIQIDLTHFNHVNESLGHEVGDRMLKDVVARIHKSVRPTDRVGRIGGDVFALMVDDVSGHKAAGAIAQKIISTLTESFLLEGYELFIGASIGIASFPECGKESKALMKNAALAVEGAKLAGANTYQYFTAKMNDEMLARVELESSLRHAFERDEIEANIQPLTCVTPSSNFPSKDNLFVLELVWSHSRFGCDTRTLLSLYERHGALDLYAEIILGVVDQFVTQAPDGAVLVVPVSLRFSTVEALYQRFEALLSKGRPDMIYWMLQEDGLDRVLSRQKNGDMASAPEWMKLGLDGQGRNYFSQAFDQLALQFVVTAPPSEAMEAKPLIMHRAFVEMVSELDIAVLVPATNSQEG